MDAAYYHNGPMMTGGNGAWVSAVFGILFFLLLVVMVIYVLRIMSNHSPASGRREPLDIARERYAKGEITKEELAEIKKELDK